MTQIHLSVTASERDIALAFTEWDRRFREEPERFQSEATRLLKETPETYGDACAPYLIHILSELRGDEAADAAEPKAPWPISLMRRKAVKTATPPVIGQVWPGQGGIYIGISRGDDAQPDAHLIMHPDYGQNLSWEDALAWAARQTADGHSGFRAPTRFESALIYANARDQVNTDKWHWTSTQYSADDAFIQLFYYGYQDNGHKKALGCVRAVRRLVL